MTDLSKLREIVARDYEQPAPNITNCVKHAKDKITERDIDCPMCGVDMREMVKAALAANKWMCEQRDEMLAEIERLTKEPEDQAPEPEEGTVSRSDLGVAVLRSEPDAVDDDSDSVLPMTLDTGERIVVGAIEGGGLPPEGLGFLRLVIERPGDADETIDYVRVSNPTRHCAEKAIEILRGYVHQG